jgi:hypothetical protein
MPIQLNFHVSGVITAFAFSSKNRTIKTDKEPDPARPQGSWYNQQRRIISDRIEYLMMHSKHKCKFITATDPAGESITTKEKGQILSRFCENFCKTYKCAGYVWVREYQENGRPHWHFVADVPWLTKNEFERLNSYYNSLFNTDLKNALRWGFKPKNGKRIYTIEDSRIAGYVSKYVGESVGISIKDKSRVTGASAWIAKGSEPCVLTIEDKKLKWDSSKLVRAVDLKPGEQMPDWVQFTGMPDLTSFDWYKCGDHSVWKGTPKSWRKFRKEKTQ